MSGKFYFLKCAGFSFSLCLFSLFFNLSLWAQETWSAKTDMPTPTALKVSGYDIAQIKTSSFEFEGLTRSYMVFLPQNYQPNMPVVFNVHGYYVDAQFQMDYTLLNNMADTSGFIVVYPEAVWPGFNSGQVLPPDYPQIPNINDVGFISALIDTLETCYEIDLNRIYACGFSNGGVMAYRLAGQLGYRFAAIATVAGQFFNITENVSEPPRAFPVLHIHGTEDVNLPYAGSDTSLWSVESTIDYWVQNNSCQSTPETILLPDLDQGDSSTVQKTSYTNCSGTSTILFYKVINGGHNWPGTNPPLTDSWAGHTNQDINANVEIWNFFKDYVNPLVDIAWTKTFEVLPRDLNSQGDSLFVKAYIANPEEHTVSVQAKFYGDKTAFSDSIQLFDDGLHFDENSNDNIWGNAKWVESLDQDKYLVDIFTNDSDAGTAIKYFWSDSLTVTISDIGVEAENIPMKYILKQNYPNPFNLSTTISYQLPQQSNVELAIYNMAGQKMATVTSEQQPAGSYQYEWNAGDLASGVYFYRLTADRQFMQVKKLILLK